MPPAPSMISRQFTPVDADGRTLMVLCNHCRSTRVPKNSLVRKENHLRVCQAYHITAAALRQQQQQQQQQNPTTTSTTTPTLNNTTDLDDTNNTITPNQNPHDTFEPDSPSDHQQNVSGSPLANNISIPVTDVLPLDILEYSINARANRSKPGNSKEARLNASGRQTSSVAEDIYSGMPYAYPLPYTSEPASLRSLIATDESRKRRRETGSPGLPNESGSPGREGVVVRGGGAKRLRYAEFYLDEEDYDFVCDARGAREERFRDIVERLARLVRLRDTRGP